MRLASDDDRSKGACIFFALALVAVICLGLPLLLSGCATADAVLTCVTHSRDCN